MLTLETGEDLCDKKGDGEGGGERESRYQRVWHQGSYFAKATGSVLLTQSNKTACVC